MSNASVHRAGNDYRVTVFGGAGVGKTSVVQRFVHGTFKENYVPTIEDTYRKVISSNNAVCTLQITDTTGSHQFPAMQKLSIQRGHAFVLIYAINKKETLNTLKTVYDEIIDIKGGADMVPIILVGNKSDDPNRQVTEAEGLRAAKQWNCAFLETSAKTNLNIQDVFEQLLHLEKRRAMSLETDTKKKFKNEKAKNPQQTQSRKKKCVLM